MKLLLTLSAFALGLSLSHGAYAQPADQEATKIVSFMKQMGIFPSKIDDHLTLKNIENSGGKIVYTIETSNGFFKNNTVSPDVKSNLEKSFLSRTCGNKLSDLMFNKGISVQENYQTDTSPTTLLSFNASKEDCSHYTGPKTVPSVMNH